MVHQAEVNTNGKAKPAEPNVRASFACLAHDAIELAELQTKLLRLDVQAATRSSGMSFALLIVGACLLLGCVPVALLALGEMLVATWGWSRAGAFAVSAGLGLLLSAGVGTAAWLRVRDALAHLERSRDEFTRNLAWVKSNLKRGETRSHSDR